MSDSAVSSLVEDREVSVKEEIHMRAADIKTEIAKNERDIDQCDEHLCRYNREYMYNVRDLEKLLAVTACPVKQEQLDTVGISPSIRRRNSFESRKDYCDATGLLILNDSPEAERMRELKQKPLIRKVLAILQKVHIVPYAFRPYLIREIVFCRVHHSPELNEIVSIIIDKAIAKPTYVAFLTDLCLAQVLSEFHECEKNGFEIRSRFLRTLLIDAQQRFTRINAGNNIGGKKLSIDVETDETKMCERPKRIGFIKVLGHLFLHRLLSHRIIRFCAVELLKTVTDGVTDWFAEGDLNEQSIECAVQLLKVVGQRLDEDHCAAEDEKPCSNDDSLCRDACAEIVDSLFATLDAAIPYVSDGLRFTIIKLVELRENGWAEVKTVN